MVLGASAAIPPVHHHFLTTVIVLAPCVEQLSQVFDPVSRDDSQIGWPNSFAHEIGHAFAVAHAPCGHADEAGYPSAVDVHYPYSDGQLGPVCGWDFRLNSFRGPGTATGTY